MKLFQHFPRLLLLFLSSFAFGENIECPRMLTDVEQHAGSVDDWIVTETESHPHDLHAASIQTSSNSEKGVFWSSERPDNYDEIAQHCDSLDKEQTCNAQATWLLDQKLEYRLECSYWKTSIVLRKSLKGFKRCTENLRNWQIQGIACTR